MYQFIEYVNTHHRMSFANYGELYAWSIEESLVFWETLWAHSEVIQGLEVKNKDALANPEALDNYLDLPELES